MKGQDIIVLLKLESLWRGNSTKNRELFTLRNMEQEIGISRAVLSRSIHRNLKAGLVSKDRKSDLLKTNSPALLEFLIHGIKYVFPVKYAEIVRGVPTAYAAPVLNGKIMSAGQLIPVWPDANGTEMGMAICPLYKSVPTIVKRDRFIYDSLALVDGIRTGAHRESEMSKQLLAELLRQPEKV